MRAKAEGRWRAPRWTARKSAAGAGFREHGASPCTDVTGFVSVISWRCARAPAWRPCSISTRYPSYGAEECLKLGITSSLQPANGLPRAANQEEISGNPRYPLIYDPVTAGGLLAAVDKDKAEACVAAARGQVPDHVRHRGCRASSSGGERAGQVVCRTPRIGSRRRRGDSLVQPVTSRTATPGVRLALQVRRLEGDEGREGIPQSSQRRRAGNTITIDRIGSSTGVLLLSSTFSSFAVCARR